MAENNIKASGSCLCGNIKIQIDGTPFRMAQCHCRDCQKGSGGGHMSLVFLPESAVSISGDAKAYDSITDSGNTASRYFCPTCGGRVYGTNTMRQGIIAVPVGIFDNRDWFEPQAIVYCRNRDDWDVTDESIANFDTMPPPA